MRADNLLLFPLRIPLFHENNPPKNTSDASFSSPTGVNKSCAPFLPNPFKKWLWIIFVLSIAITMTLTFDDVVEWENGLPRLKPWRLEKWFKEEDEINNAEQYVLVANRSDWYPCLTCPNKKIYLFSGQIWKYGVTRKQVIGRYGRRNLVEQGLRYIIEFEGNYALCLLEEKRKLYQYPLLPENLARPDSSRLVYPPGNTQAK